MGASLVVSPPLRTATGLSNGMLATMFVIVAESTVFAGLAASFNILRSQYNTWPPMGQPRLPAEATALNSVMLLLSGIACERAARCRTPAETTRWLGIALFFAVGFLGAQGREWWSLVQFGLTGTSVFGGLFYSLVGTHAVHVLFSVVLLAHGVRAVHTGRWSAIEVGTLRVWWWFVVLLWPFIYWLVYLR